jgi:hypothetical protein
METNKTISKKLVNILASLSSVPKQGYNKHQNYAYMREVDVLEALKTELIKNKIIMLTSSKLVDLKEKEKSYLTTVETSHTFLDSESGEQLTITSVGSGWDSTDKGSAKAITSACKYALMKTFMISDEGQDIENDGEAIQTPKTFTPTVTTPKTFNKAVKTATTTITETKDNSTTIINVEHPEGSCITSKLDVPKTETTPVKKFSFGKRQGTNVQPKEDVEFGE